MKAEIHETEEMKVYTIVSECGRDNLHIGYSAVLQALAAHIEQKRHHIKSLEISDNLHTVRARLTVWK